MAIHPYKHRGIEVTVCFAATGKPLREYDCYDFDEFHNSAPLSLSTNHNKLQVTTYKYIEALTDKEFTVKLNVAGNYKF
jgi:hypothetical protein